MPPTVSVGATAAGLVPVEMPEFVGGFVAPKPVALPFKVSFGCAGLPYVIVAPARLVVIATGIAVPGFSSKKAGAAAAKLIENGTEVMPFRVTVTLEAPTGASYGIWMFITFVAATLINADLPPTDTDRPVHGVVGQVWSAADVHRFVPRTCASTPGARFVEASAALYTLPIVGVGVLEPAVSTSKTSPAKYNVPVCEEGSPKTMATLLLVLSENDSASSAPANAPVGAEETKSMRSLPLEAS